MLLDCEREVYLPAVDDHGVDIIVRTKDYNPTTTGTPNSYEFQELQVKSVSTGGLFAALKCGNPRPNYWFVFYIKDIDEMWLINSMQLVKIASCVTKLGSRAFGKYTINLKPVKKTPIKYPQYHITDFTPLP
jgi:hypothetical protein